MRKAYTTVMNGMRGYFSALISWYEEDQMWDVTNTSDFSYKTYDEAREDAKDWAKVEGVEYKV